LGEKPNLHHLHHSPIFGTGLQGAEIQGIREQASILRIFQDIAHDLKKQKTRVA